LSRNDESLRATDPLHRSDNPSFSSLGKGFPYKTITRTIAVITFREDAALF